MLTNSEKKAHHAIAIVGRSANPTMICSRLMVSAWYNDYWVVGMAHLNLVVATQQIR